jgi:type II secretory pathway component PulL
MSLQDMRGQQTLLNTREITMKDGDEITAVMDKDTRLNTIKEMENSIRARRLKLLSEQSATRRAVSEVLVLSVVILAVYTVYKIAVLLTS